MCDETERLDSSDDGDDDEGNWSLEDIAFEVGQEVKFIFIDGRSSGDLAPFDGQIVVIEDIDYEDNLFPYGIVIDGFNDGSGEDGESEPYYVSAEELEPSIM